ncbi:YbaB/EbfC family nucleoid-associated protein [Amycolatopsis sp. cg5]|uniref:YbaB/EbfC family nucleoid-associated protein n=1 Tax=Amycolatopsis sp. cg5 TaxID=3238802 RepID=UPI00352334D3
MTTPGDDRARLEARNAAMKDTVDSLLEQFTKQTEQLREAQTTAAQLSAQVRSPDGLVKATIDSSGSLAQLSFAPQTFERTNPAQLANTVLTLVRQGSLQVKQQVADLMAPITGDLPDLADMIEGAPSLEGLLPPMPTFIEQDVPAPTPPRPESIEDPDASSILRGASETTPPPAPPRPAPMPAPKPASQRRARPQPAEEDEEPPSTWLRGGN